MGYDRAVGLCEGFDLSYTVASKNVDGNVVMWQVVGDMNRGFQCGNVERECS